MPEPAANPGAAGVSLTLDISQEGIATLSFATSRGSAIPLGVKLLRELELKLQELEDESAHERVRLLVIRSAPPHPTLSGYDLEEIRALSGGGIVGWSHEGQAILRRLEQLPFPSVALVQGGWAGGAAELALACSYRVAAAMPEARLAFPQTRRGLLPAWGGTVRLPRLVGLHTALRLILTGDPVEAREARDLGLIDRIIPVDAFDERLERHLKKLAGSGDRRLKRRRKLGRRLVEDTAPGRRLLGARAVRRHLADGSATLAARLALELMVETCALPLAQAFDRESAMAGELIVTNETQGRLHSERVTELAATPAAAWEETEAAAIIGGGQMGSDFARFLIAGGTPVRIKDARDVARIAVARTRARIEWEVKQEHLTEEEGISRAAMIEAATGFGGFGLLDLAIVVPDGTPGDVGALLAEVEGHIREDCLLAFHDWTLPPAALQAKLARPDRSFGIGTALPLDRYPLLEIVAGPETSAESLDAARQLASRGGMTPVVVRAPTPTPWLRLISVYFAEAARILEEGIPVDVIDNAMEDFGFVLGPFRRIDGIGTRRVRRILDDVSDSIGARANPGRIFRGIAEEGRTFYRYRNGRPAGLAPELPEPSDGEDSSPDDVTRWIQQRILLLLIDEAARIVQDGCVSDPADLEAIALIGLGFPREHGGLLYYAQTIGLERILNGLRKAEHEIGPHFAPSPALIDLSGAGGGFFADPDTASGHASAPMLE